MDNKRLLETLRHLHEELSQTEQIDPETLDELQAIAQDIERVLNQKTDAAAESEPSSSKLRDLLLRFEGDHPELAAAIGKVADGLAAIGI